MYCQPFFFSIQLLAAQGKFLCQIIWMKTDGKKLDVLGTNTLFNGNVARVTRLVVKRKSEPPSFLLTVCRCVSVCLDHVESRESHGGVWYQIM